MDVEQLMAGTMPLSHSAAVYSSKLQNRHGRFSWAMPMRCWEGHSLQGPKLGHLTLILLKAPVEASRAH